jgi:peptide/nickel transport system substrate-binding protein
MTPELETARSDQGQEDPPILDGTYKLPVTDGSGRDRNVLKQAVVLSQGRRLHDQGRQDGDASGRQLAFEIMTQNADQEKLAVAYQRSLQISSASPLRSARSTIRSIRAGRTASTTT